MTIVRTVSSPSRRLSPTTNHQQPTTNTSLHRHALREVARLVDVAAAHHGNVIRQELQRHHGEQRRQELLDARTADDVLAEIGEAGVIGVGDGDAGDITWDDCLGWGCAWD